MKVSSRDLIKLITERLKNYMFMTDTNVAFKQTTAIAQKKLAHAQNVAVQKYNTIVKQINGSTIIQDVNYTPLQPAEPLPKQVIVWWKWYQHLTGLDNIEHARHRVVVVQNKLFECQEKRRQLTQHAAVLNNNLTQVYGELIQTKREDPKYVQLTILENKSLQECKQINEQMSLLETEEKEHFTELATAIKEYHDSQTLNAMKYKYLSVVASALFAIVSLVGSMIYNNKRIRDVRNVITRGQIETQHTYITTLENLQNHISKKITDVSKSPSHITVQNNDLSEEIASTVQTYVIVGIIGYCILKLIIG